MLRNRFNLRKVIATVVCLAGFSANSVLAQGTMVDSGLDYTEATELVKNPFMGFVNNGWPADGAFWLTETGTSQVHVTSGFAWYYVNLNKFSAGNKPDDPNVMSEVGGVDKPITAAALEAFAQALETLRQNGGSAMFRFVYDWNGYPGCEPADFNMILTHIGQLSEVMSNYDDIILGIECGIIGVFGEMHSSIYTGSEYANPIMDAYLDNTPETIRLLVRTPGYIANYLGVDRADLKDIVTEEGTKAYRLGMFNDGYMNSNSDLGTWINRAEEIKFLFTQNAHVPYGGEFGSAWTNTSIFPNDACMPENAIPEMYQSHLSYLHSDIYHIGQGSGDHINTLFGYDQYTYGTEYEQPWYPDNSAFYGMTCYDFIRAHLGYRLVLRESKLSEVPRQREALELSGLIENTGFSNILHNPTAQVLMTQNGDIVHTFDVELDASDLLSCTTFQYDLTLPLPISLPVGDYDIYLRLAGSNGSNVKVENGIRFANNGEIYDSTLGANKLGTVTVEEATGINICDDERLQIYPNPVKDVLQIGNGDLQIENIEIFDITGKIVGNSVNVATLPAGVYPIKIVTNKGIIRDKIVKE
ncbi:MAG: DUF4832 domain-containing protein [Bacteroidales bacterium]|nr:DUF4832 domain-containing protein [Bacteroidales bacterium]